MHKLEEWFYKYKKILKGQNGLVFSVAVLIFYMVLFNDLANNSTSIGMIFSFVRLFLIFSAIYALICFISRKIR